jgi:hypothetical protein
MTLFEGTWSQEPGGYFKSGGTTPAGHEETCGWLPGGRRHMVCRAWREETKGAPRREAIQILSYREADSTYIARFAFPGGATLEYHGRIEGDRWVMNLQPGPNWPANQRLRTIITAVPGGLRYVEEHSVDGGPWTITEDYRHRRVR